MSETAKRHAPRGPLKARATDPTQPLDPMRCTATRRNGEQCGSKPIRGGNVCRMHGGGAPQVKAKAERRLAALQIPAISRLSELMQQKEFPSTAYQAVRDVLDRTMGKPTERQEVAHSGGLVITHEVPV